MELSVYISNERIEIVAGTGSKFRGLGNGWPIGGVGAVGLL